MKKHFSKLSCLMLAILLTFSMWGSSMLAVFATEPAETNEIPANNAQQIEISNLDQYNDPIEKTSEDGAVTISKTLKPTEMENIFDVTLNVKTKQTVKEVYPDMAVVLLIDTSASMTPSRLNAAKAAATTFIDAYSKAPGDATREIGILTFNKDVNPIASMTDIKDNADTLTKKVEKIGNTVAATNIQAGLNNAYKMLDGTNIAKENCYVVLLSDGKPNCHYNTNGTYHAPDGGDITRHDDHLAVSNGKDAIGDRIYDEMNLYSVYLGGNDNVNCTSGNDCTLNQNGGTGIVEWLKTFSNDVKQTIDEGDLEKFFKDICNQIVYPTVWTVDDPMGEHIQFISSTEDAKTYNSDTVKNTNNLVWNLKKSKAITGENDEKIFTFKYQIKLDNVSDGFVEGKVYDTNGKTTLHYSLDENPDSEEGKSIIKHFDFDVPAVKGYLSDISFTKVGNGNALPGAKFKLEGTNGYKATELTSDADGKLVFSNIPSGYAYTLTEVEAPEGYVKDTTPRTIKVAYDKVYEVKNGGLTEIINGFEWINNPVETPKTELTVNKIWEDENDKDKIRPNELYVSLFAGEEFQGVKVLNEGNGWTKTFTNLEKMKDGKEIEYTVVEGNVEGYKPGITEYSRVGNKIIATITNRLLPKEEPPVPTEKFGKFSIEKLVTVMEESDDPEYISGTIGFKFGLKNTVTNDVIYSDAIFFTKDEIESKETENVDFNNIPEGTYSLIEKMSDGSSLADGWSNDLGNVEVVVDSEGKTTVNGEAFDCGYYLVKNYYNHKATPEKWPVMFGKAFQNEAGETITTPNESFTFNLFDVKNNTIAASKTVAFNPNSNGLVVIEDVAPGTYRLQEVESTDWTSSLESNPIWVEVEENGNVNFIDKDGNKFQGNLVVVNTFNEPEPIKHTVTFKKIFKDDKENILVTPAGVDFVFALMQAGVRVAEATVANDGTVIFNDIEVGTYILTEDSKEGWSSSLTTEPITVVVSKDGVKFLDKDGKEITNPEVVNTENGKDEPSVPPYIPDPDPTPDPQPPVVDPDPDPVPPDENLPEEPSVPDTPDVDVPEKPDIEKPDMDKPELPDDEYQKEDTDQPKTGDSQNMAGWTAILMTSLAALGVTLAVRRKEEK